MTAFWYYFGFCLGGVACVLPGVLMPAMIASWHLSDHRAGIILLCVNAGGAAGALLARGNLHRRIALGGSLLTLTGFAWPANAFPPELPAIGWGLGMGLLLTAVSLTRQRIPRASATELVRLNFIWAVGAFLCAPLLSHALHFDRIGGALHGVALVFGLFTVGTLFLRADATANAPMLSEQTRQRALRRVPPSLIICTILAPGVEAACGGWLSTYASRYQGSLFTVVAAPTCLWMGLLCSRATAWLPRAEGRLQRSSFLFVVIVLVAAAGLLTLFSPTALLLFSFLMGFGLGPLYPLFLSRVLNIREGGTIFFLAGVTSSLMPYLTGLLSSLSGSLHIGFLVIAAGAAGIGILFFTGVSGVDFDCPLTSA